MDHLGWECLCGWQGDELFSAPDHEGIVCPNCGRGSGLIESVPLREEVERLRIENEALRNRVDELERNGKKGGIS